MEIKRVKQVGWSTNEQLKECIETTDRQIPISVSISIYRHKGTEAKRGQMKGQRVSHEFHHKLKSSSPKMIRMEDICTEIPQTKHLTQGLAPNESSWDSQEEDTTFPISEMRKLMPYEAKSSVQLPQRRINLLLHCVSLGQVPLPKPPFLCFPVKGPISKGKWSAALLMPLPGSAANTVGFFLFLFFNKNFKVFFYSELMTMNLSCVYLGKYQ